MAPEQVEKPLTVDHRADIYSLGVVFYEMLTGELPLGKFQPPSACARGVQIDVRLDGVVLHALEKAPERRYQHASQVKMAVETIATTPRSSGRESAPSSLQESQDQIASAAAASPLRRGVLTGLGVFLGVVILATAITFLMPESYVGIARVELAGASPQNYDPYRMQTEFGVMESSVVLKPVADSLNLGARWKKMFSTAGRILPDDEVVDLMKRQLTLQPVRNTSIIEVQFNSQSPKEAAEIANKISEVYCSLPPGHRGEIIDPATVPLRPSRPNRPLNIFIGVVTGTGLGIFTGIAVGLLALLQGRAARRAMSPSPMQKPNHFWRWFFAAVIACLVFIPVAIAILGLLASIAIPNFVKARQHSQQLAAQQWKKEGWQLWQAQKMDQAAAKFQQAVQLVPEDADAWNGLGWSTFNSGKSQEAEQAFQKAVSLDTNQPGALNGLGQIYLSRRIYGQAETYLLKAAPQAPAAWYGLTRLYLLEGKFDQAESCAQKLVDSGQADDLARQMLTAAQGKHLSEGLRFRIEPPPAANITGSTPAGSTSMDSVPMSAAVQSAADNAQTVAGLPPVVVETRPVSGAHDVEPGVAEIRVRFSKEMADGSWSWSTAWENSTPETIGHIHYEPDQRTCVLKAKLEPGHTYAWWLNSDKFKNFTDLAGRPAVPYLLIFQTKQN
jgi:tetratricopeptide (TPR) repeat protein